jgi:chromosome segregation ATPase
MKLGKIIAQISSNSQFIGITHNDTIVREADQIVGVALNEQKSSVVGLRLKEKQAD